MSKVLKSNELDWSEWRESPTIGMRYKAFTPDPSFHIGVGISELAPGCNTGTAHYHMKEEEHVFVLEGSMEVRLGKEWQRLDPGDYLCFRAGDPTEHKFRNPFAVPCRYLMFGERMRDDVVVYPDVNAARVRLLRDAVRIGSVPVPEIDD